MSAQFIPGPPAEMVRRYLLATGQYDAAKAAGVVWIAEIAYAVGLCAERDEVVQALVGLADAAKKRREDGRAYVRADVEVRIRGEKLGEVGKR